MAAAWRYATAPAKSARTWRNNCPRPPATNQSGHRVRANPAVQSGSSPEGYNGGGPESLASSGIPCRVLPVDGSSRGRQVNPPCDGCTFGTWSPDGHWMYVTSDAG